MMVFGDERKAAHHTSHLTPDSPCVQREHTGEAAAPASPDSCRGAWIPGPRTRNSQIPAADSQYSPHGLRWGRRVPWS